MSRVPGVGEAFPLDDQWHWHVLPVRGLGPLRAVGLAVDGDGVLRQVRLNPPGRSAGAPCRDATRPTRAAAQELDEYLTGGRQAFTLRWRLPEDCPPFRRDILETAAQIPYGATLSYGDLAARAGHEGAARAVGGAMGANPLPLIIPCHRVVAAGRRIGGFTGGVHLKRALLIHEGWLRNPDAR